MTLHRFANLTFLGALLAASLTVSGCSNSSNASTADEDAELLKMHKEAKSTTEKISVPPPSIVYIAVDNSMSMKNARTDAPKIADVQPLVDLLSRTGGTLGISTICSQSDKPLVRITFSAPPSLPQLPDKPSKDSNKNPFEATKEYTNKKKYFKEKMPKTLEEIRKLEKQFKENYKNNRALAKGFQPKLKNILNQPRSCQLTDIKSSINRANLLFNEPNTSETNKIRKFAVFITDGKHDIKPKNSKQATKIQLNQEQIFLVNGSSDIGTFSSIPHKRFEAPSPAFKVLVDLMSKKENKTTQQ